MNRRTARGNRLGLVIVGVILLAAGAFALVRGLGLATRLPPGEPVVSAAERRMAHTAPWFWWAAAVVAVIVLLLALRWLLVQGRSSRITTLRLDGGADGDTRMPSRAITRAVEHDVTETPGVVRAHAALVGSRSRPTLRLDLTADDRADWPRLRQDVAGRVRDDLAASLELDELPTIVRVRMAAHGGRDPELA